MMKLLLILLFALTFYSSTDAQQKSTDFTGPWMGQKAPGMIPEIFAPGIISTEAHEFSCCFSPDGNEFYFTRMIPEERQNYIMYTRLLNAWIEPEIAPFAGPFTFEPFITPDNKRAYFQTGKVTDGQLAMYTMYVERTEKGWSEATPVDQVINQMSMHWQFSVDKKGNIYFASDNAGGFGMQDIYCSELIDGKYQKPENLGEKINTDRGDMTPFISPDGDYLIFCRGLELHISYKEKNGNWSMGKSLGAPVNTGFELCPIVTPDGRFLIFLSGREGESHPFWVSAKVIDDLRSED